MAPLKLGRQKLLIVDDEDAIRTLLTDLLSEEFESETATNGIEAVKVAQEWKPDLILMDVMMPKMDGIDACAALRKDESTRHIPVIMLTAMNATYDRVKAFDHGADDFISKPFDFEELLSRLRSKVRRVKELQNAPQEILVLGNIYVNIPGKEVKVNDKVVDLQPVEYGILTLLLKRKGEVVSRADIMTEVWGTEKKTDRLIDAHLTGLRKKIAKFDGEIQTVYGEGYRIKV